MFGIQRLSTRFHSCLGLVLGSLLLLACSGGGGGSNAGGGAPVPSATLTSIQLAPAAPTLNIGGTLDLQSTGNFSNGTSTTPFDTQVTWVSSAPAVATVNTSGVVTGMAAGTSTITATSNGVQGTATVTVALAARTLTGIDLNPTSMTLAVGSLRDIAASAIWSDGTGSSGFNGSVTWTSSNPGVARVSNLGMVTPVAAGSTTITAAASGRSATCAVTVTGAAAPALTSLTVSPASGSLAVGSILYLTPIGHYSDGSSSNIIPITSVLWTSNNTSVATIDAYGIVTSVAAGSATITASISGKSATVPITVTASTSFDARLVGNWRWIGVPDGAGNIFGSFYHFYSNGTFTYDLIYQSGAGSCISYSMVVAHHEGTFSSQGSLDTPASAGKIIFNCSTHHTDYTSCSNATTRYSYTGANPHFHWATFSGGNLITNHTDDFNTTGNIEHARY